MTVKTETDDVGYQQAVRQLKAITFTPEYVAERTKALRKRASKARQSMAVGFLHSLRPNGPWVLSAIEPDGPITTKTLHTAKAVRAFVRAHSGRRNIYYAVNPTTSDLTKKAKKEDIAAVEYIHADLDPRDNEAPAEAKDRYLQAIAQQGLDPSLIVDSGNGLNVLYRLTKPLPPEQFDKAEASNLALTTTLGGPAGTQDVSRILRLPGTLNLPTKKKRKLGRSDRHARCIVARRVRHKLSAFPKAELKREPTATVPVRDSDLVRRVPPALAGIIRDGAPEGERSDLFFKVVATLKGLGGTVQQIVDLLHGFPNGIAAKYRGRLPAEVQRAFDKAQASDQIIITTRTADQFEVKDLDFLWMPLLPLGMITSLVGDGDVGKSTIMIDIAARLTTGRAMPAIGDERPQKWPVCSAMFLCKEDSVGLVIRRRLEAARADLKRVHFPEIVNPLDPDNPYPLERLDNVAAALEQRIIEIGDVRLIVIDPITEYVGKIDMYRDDQVRALLTPLARIAERHKIAIVLILHHNKKADLAARHRTLGSVAFRNVPRSSLLVAPSGERDGVRLVIQEKGNLVPMNLRNRAAAFSITGAIGRPRVVWEREWQQANADDILNQKGPTKQVKAEGLLRDWLKDGPMLVKEVEALAKDQEIGWRTVRSAKDKLGIIATKRKHGWEWKLPGTG